MVFERRNDAHYFLTMSYQKPDIGCESHDPYVVLNRLRTLLVTIDTLDCCEDCEQKNAGRNGDFLETELKKQYQEVDQLFTCINAFAEKVVACFDQHAQLCERCQILFHVGATAAQAMQDSIYENPETPDTMWLSQSRCIEELVSAVSLQNEKPQRDYRVFPAEGEPVL